MNNDLISREALKKTLCEECEAREHYIGEIMLKAIDNAPAVDTYTIEDIQKVREDSLILGAKLAQRPQGEWIFEKANEEHTDGYICSNCKRSFHTKVPYFSEFNFCPNCGADMRGGAE